MMLAQNKYYVVPTVNVDGVAYIEDIYLRNGTFVEKRTNMHILNKTCSATRAGVDLNRNYGFLWGKFTDKEECSGNMWAGAYAFSEPETRAIRDFMLAKRYEIKFVSNFHAFGKGIITPNNAEFPNNMAKSHAKIRDLMKEFSEEANIPQGTDIGPISELLGFITGGAAGDWISQELDIAAVEPEIGSADDYFENWLPKDVQTAFRIVNENY